VGAVRFLSGLFGLLAVGGLLAACSTGGSAPHVTTTAHTSVGAVTPSEPPPTATRPSTSHAPTSRPTSVAPRPSSSVSVTPRPHGPVVLLNPGHNGDDAAHPEIINKPINAGYGKTKACETTGTSTNSGYPEHAFNWDVALRVRTLLAAHGVRVIMTRSSDNGVGPCANTRAFLGNRADVAAQISIHADGAPSSGHGFHVCEDSHQPGGAAVAAQSHRLTVALHDALLAGSGMTVSSYFGQDGYVRRDDLTGLNLATRPATFLEIGNMRNAGDAALQTSTAGRQRIAAAVAAGILHYLGR
jgi:N-acetylmuramoyl-L-alanine amidase